MKKHNSSISNATDYKGIGEFWDTHDATDYMEQSKSVEMIFDIDTEVTYCALDNELSQRVITAAKKHGISSNTLINMWVQDKLQQEA